MYVTCSKRHFSSQRFLESEARLNFSSSPDHFVMPPSAAYLTERRSDRNDQHTHAWVSAGLLTPTHRMPATMVHEAEEKFATIFTTANRSLSQKSHDFFSWGYIETHINLNNDLAACKSVPHRVSRPVSSRDHLSLCFHPSSLALKSTDAVSVVDERSQRFQFRYIATFYY